MAFLSKNAIFRPETEQEAIARQSVEASREVSCAYFCNIGRNSRYFLLPIFLAVHPTVHLLCGFIVDVCVVVVVGDVVVVQVSPI